MANWYVSSVYYTAVAQWQALHAYSVGDIVRQLAAPAFGNERCYRCTTAGTSGATEALINGGGGWSLTKSATNTDATVTWTEVTGLAAWNESHLIGGNYVGWRAPHATIFTAGANGGSSWAAAGDNVIVGGGSAHSETPSSATTYNFNGTNALPINVINVLQDAGTTNNSANTANICPPISAYRWQTTDVQPYYIGSYINGAQSNAGTYIHTTGNSNLTFQGYAVINNFRFGAATNNTASTADIIFSSGVIILENCSLTLGSTQAGQRIKISAGAKAIWRQTSVSFFSGSQSVENSGDLEWANTNSMDGLPGIINTGGSTPTTLITGTSTYGNVLLDSLDMTALSGKTIIGASFTGKALITNCSLPASVTIGAPTSSISRVDAIITDVKTAIYGDAVAAYRNESYQYAGTLTTNISSSSPSALLTATDSVKAFSWKVVTTANSSFSFPFQCVPITTWYVAQTYAQTATIEIITDNVTLTDKEIWVEVEYLGTNNEPIGQKLSNRCWSFGDSATTHLTSSASWTTSGITTPIKQQLFVNICPLVSGYVKVTVFVAKPSTTVYINPKVAFTDFVIKPTSFVYQVYNQPATNMSYMANRGISVNEFPDQHADSESAAVSAATGGLWKFLRCAKGPAGRNGWLGGQPATDAADSNCFGLAPTDEPAGNGYGYASGMKQTVYEWLAVKPTGIVSMNFNGPQATGGQGTPDYFTWAGYDYLNRLCSDDYTWDDGNSMYATGLTNSSGGLAYSGLGTGYTTTAQGQAIENMKTGFTGRMRATAGRIYGQVISTVSTQTSGAYPDSDFFRLQCWSSIIHGASFLELWTIVYVIPRTASYNNSDDDTPPWIWDEFAILRKNVSLLETTALMDTSGGRRTYTVRFCPDSDKMGIFPGASIYPPHPATQTFSSPVGTQMQAPFEACTITGSDGTYYIILNLLWTNQTLTDATYGLTNVVFGPHEVKVYKNGTLLSTFFNNAMQMVPSYPQPMVPVRRNALSHACYADPQGWSKKFTPW